MNTCPVCRSSDLKRFIEIPEVPVHCNLLWPTRDEALHAPRADIRLAFCKACGHIFNVAFDPDRMQYTQEYENSLHFSARFQEYATSLAARLIDRYDLHDKDIIEIGCGKGDFLVMLCELGSNRGVGFDPSYIDERTDATTQDRISFVRDFYSKRYAHYKAHLICCRHVLEHIQHPCEFLANLRDTIGNRLETNLFFEVPNVDFTLKHLGIWDIIYEHCSYFSVSSLAHIFAASGFEICDLQEAFDGQFLCLDALPAQGLPASKHDPWNHGLKEMAHDVSVFGERYLSKAEMWRSELERIGQPGHRAVVWGGGSKGVTFLNTLKIKDHVGYVVDINPHKQGKHVAGTGQKIVSPDFLKEYGPDSVIVMNPVYREEIRKSLNQMALNPKIISV